MPVWMVRFRHIAVAHHSLAATGLATLGMYIKERLQFSLYSLSNELSGPQTQQLGERVMGIDLWWWQGAEDRMVHGVSPLLIETLSGINRQDTPPPLWKVRTSP